MNTITAKVAVTGSVQHNYNLHTAEHALTGSAAEYKIAVHTVKLAVTWSTKHQTELQLEQQILYKISIWMIILIIMILAVNCIQNVSIISSYFYIAISNQQG